MNVCYIKNKKTPHAHRLMATQLVNVTLQRIYITDQQQIIANEISKITMHIYMIFI